MRNINIFILAFIFILTMSGCGDKPAGQEPAATTSAASAHEGIPSAAGEVPVKGMVTMIDLGADKCVPCKMMAPILVELEKEYEGRAAIVFLDVWKDKAPAERFGIRAIPTQIFFDDQGNEVHRHVGFLSKEEIVAQLKKMGVE